MSKVAIPVLATVGIALVTLGLQVFLDDPRFLPWVAPASIGVGVFLVVLALAWLALLLAYEAVGSLRRREEPGEPHGVPDLPPRQYVPPTRDGVLGTATGGHHAPRKGAQRPAAGELLAGTAR